MNLNRVLAPRPLIRIVRMRPSVACLLVGLVALLLGDVARADDRLMILTVDLTPEGKKVAPPTPEDPTYYVPVFLGYKERGELFKHYEREPAADDIQQFLVETLAMKGYLVASHQFPPTMTITFEWGSVAPVFDPKRRVINQGEIRAIVLGNTEWDVANRYAGHSDEILSLTARHYLLISAFIYQRAAQKEDVLLWRAHSTTDAWGNYLDEVIQPLIALAAPALGRETRPGASWDERAGRVILGQPEVVKDHPGALEKTK